MASLAVNCGLCKTEVMFIHDPRVLPCGHVFCKTCLDQLKADTPSDAITECYVCKHPIEKKIVENLRRASIRTLKVLVPKEQSCDVDKCTRNASVFCTDCQIKYCDVHKDNDDSGHSSHVDIATYLSNAKPYVKHYCASHTKDLVDRVCTSCQKVFCRQCEPADEACVNTASTSIGRTHHLTDDFGKVAADTRERVRKLIFSLYHLANTFIECERRVRDDSFRFFKTEDAMLAEVDRFASEHIARVEACREKIKDQIRRKILLFNDKVDRTCQEYTLLKEKADDLVVALRHISEHQVDSKVIQLYADLSTQINDVIEAQQIEFSVPSMKLVPSQDKCSGLGLELHETEMIPNAIELVCSAENDGEGRYSANWLPDYRIAVAGRGFVEWRDARLKVIRSVEVSGSCSDLQPYSNVFGILLTNSGKKSIHIYDKNLRHIKELASFKDTAHITQLGLTDSLVMAVDSSTRSLRIYDYEGSPKHVIELKEMKTPRGLCMTSDGNVLISDRSENGRVTKYRLGDDYSPIWSCSGLRSPNGIAESEDGTIYSCSWEGGLIYQIDASGILLRKLTCEDLKAMDCLYDLSIKDNLLVLTSRYEEVKLFRLFKTS